MTQPKLTLLYDGSCPICSWEKRSAVEAVSCASPEFDPVDYGVTMEALMERLHGITADGRMIVGVQTLLASYRAVGWWWVYLPLSIVPHWLADLTYMRFAKHRQELSRRFGHLFGPVCEKNICRR